MLTRPLPPFRVRPLHKVTTLKTFSLEQIRTLSEAEPQSIKAPRRALKLQKPGDTQRLKVLNRETSGKA